MGNGKSYFGDSLSLYAKTIARNIKTIWSKDSHTNHNNNVGINI